MIVMVMIGYYVFAVALLAGVGYATAQNNARRFKARADEMIANLERFRDSDPSWSEPLGSCTATVPVFTFSLHKHPESRPGTLSAMAAVLISHIDRLDRSLGGEGVVFDPTGTIEAPNRLTVRVMAKSGSGAIRRFNAIQQSLDELRVLARQQVIEDQDADRNTQIVAALGSPVTRDVREAAELLDPVGA